MIEHCQIEALLCFLRVMTVISSLSDWEVQRPPQENVKQEVYKTHREGKGRELPHSNIQPKRIQTKGTVCRRGEGQGRGEHTEVFQQWSTHFLNLLLSETSRGNVSADHYKKNFRNRVKLAGSKNEDCYGLKQLDANSHRNMLFCALAHTKHHNLISFGKPWAQPGWEAITIFLGKIIPCYVIVDCSRYNSLCLYVTPP